MVDSKDLLAPSQARIVHVQRAHLSLQPGWQLADHVQSTSSRISHGPSLCHERNLLVGGILWHFEPARPGAGMAGFDVMTFDYLPLWAITDSSLPEISCLSSFPRSFLPLASAHLPLHITQQRELPRQSASLHSFRSVSRSVSTSC